MHKTTAIARKFVVTGDNYEEQSAELLKAFYRLPSPIDTITVAKVGARVHLYVDSGFFDAKVIEVSIKEDTKVKYKVTPTRFVTYGSAKLKTARRSGKKLKPNSTYRIGRSVWVTGDFENLTTE